MKGEERRKEDERCRHGSAYFRSSRVQTCFQTINFLIFTFRSFKMIIFYFKMEAASSLNRNGTGSLELTPTNHGEISSMEDQITFGSIWDAVFTGEEKSKTSKEDKEEKDENLWMRGQIIRKKNEAVLNSGGSKFIMVRSVCTKDYARIINS